MKKNTKYNFFEMGVEFGTDVAEYPEKLIISLLAERIRTIIGNYGIKEAAKYKQGAVLAIKHANKNDNEIKNYNNKATKTR